MTVILKSAQSNPVNDVIRVFNTASRLVLLLFFVMCCWTCGKGPFRKEGRKEMFYLTTQSTHFIYGYMASDIW